MLRTVKAQLSGDPFDIQLSIDATVSQLCLQHAVPSEGIFTFVHCLQQVLLQSHAVHLHFFGMRCSCKLHLRLHTKPRQMQMTLPERIQAAVHACDG